MKNPINCITVLIFLLSLTLSGFSQEAAIKKEQAIVNEKCPISDEAVNPKCTVEYEGKTYGFCRGECREKFKEDRANSLYEKIGGHAAIDATVDLFYVKVLADERVNDFFEDVNMKRQHNKQKAFISAALGGPQPWEGKDMRKAHASMDIDESDFNVIAGHLQRTLEELKVKKELIEQVMAVVGSTKDAVLNRGKPTE